MREQRAFAAVHEDGTIFIRSIARTEGRSECFFNAAWNNGWVQDATEAYRQGWRIRPVMIRVEDAEIAAAEEPSHDR